MESYLRHVTLKLIRNINRLVMTKLLRMTLSTICLLAISVEANSAGGTALKRVIDLITHTPTPVIRAPLEIPNEPPRYSLYRRSSSIAEYILYEYQPYAASRYSKDIDEPLLKEILQTFLGSKALSEGIPSVVVSGLSLKFRHAESYSSFIEDAFGHETVNSYRQSLESSNTWMARSLYLESIDSYVDIEKQSEFIKRFTAASDKADETCAKHELKRQINHNLKRSFNKVQFHNQRSGKYIPIDKEFIQRELNSASSIIASEFIDALPDAISQPLHLIDRFDVQEDVVSAEIISICGIKSEVEIYYSDSKIKMAQSVDGNYAITPRLNRLLLSK